MTMIVCGACGRSHSPPLRCRHCGIEVQVCEARFENATDSLYHLRKCERLAGKVIACGPVDSGRQ